ncbi:MAG: amidohydrolase, partial [Acidimicrobiales bacterium]|nr:amidohydrolase [Acidimicrobiales bacterium]
MPSVDLPDIPRIVSVDDHVIEPHDVWQDRLPRHLRDRGPRLVRERVSLDYTGGVYSFRRDDPDGEWCDVWLYDDLAYPTSRLMAAAGFDRSEVTNRAVTYDDMRKGCWDQAARLADMDANHVEASLCFPTFPRFCGQHFLEYGDRELGLACVRAYNDWMIEEWCGGDGAGRLVPLTLVPLWDAHAAADEVRRCAAAGSHAVTFSENPTKLDLPSIHSGHWEPFLGACADTETVINMHIGSSSSMPSTSADAPAAVASALTAQNAQGSLADWLFAGVFVRHPDLRIAYSEGQIGWMPYLLERMDTVWRENSAWGGVNLPNPPSSYVPGHVYGCIFDDPHGLACRDIIGMDLILFETDYPHADSTWPDSRDVAARI